MRRDQATPKLAFIIKGVTCNVNDNCLFGVNQSCLCLCQGMACAKCNSPELFGQRVLLTRKDGGLWDAPLFHASASVLEPGTTVLSRGKVLHESNAPPAFMSWCWNCAGLVELSSLFGKKWDNITLSQVPELPFATRHSRDCRDSRVTLHICCKL